MPPGQPGSRRKSASLLNTLTILLLLGTLVVGAFFAAITFSPELVPPVLQPATLPALAQLPAAVPTSRIPTLPPRWTATAGLTPSLTPTASQTFTPLPTPTHTATPAPVTPSASPSATPTASRTPSAFRFTIQGDEPSYAARAENSADCNWMGVGGQAFDLEGHPILGLVVRLQGEGLDKPAGTGNSPDYGPGGYEIFIGDKPRDTTGVFRVQLQITSGAPLSDWIYFNTYDDCSRNLILVNFVQNHE